MGVRPDPTRDYWDKSRDDNERLGACVRILRQQAMLTLGELAEHLNRHAVVLDVPTLSRVETGSFIPTPSAAVALSNWMVNQDPERVLQALGSPATRGGDPQTSHDAGRSVSAVTMKTLHLWWLRHLDRTRHHDPDQLTIEGNPIGYRATDEGARHFYSGPTVSDSGFRTRRAELVHAGLVQDSGLRYRIGTGRLAIAWEITTAGRLALKETAST
jgi:hypothetical protein